LNLEREMSVTILLIRHGETAWNREKVFRGVYDIPLNENGRLQAGLLAEAMAPCTIDAAYTSPLSRARETAQIALAPQGIEAADHEGLTDFNYGDWTGLSEGLVAQKWPREYSRWMIEPYAVHPPGGDTLQDVLDRAFECVEKLSEDHAGQTIALFAHRVVNKLLILGMLTLGVERFAFIRQDNCCVNEFERTKTGYIVIRLNDTAHIRQAGTDLLKADF
jgi:broad specificity phosphatase PhoE